MAIKDILPWNRSSDKVEIVPSRERTESELDRFEPIWDHWMNDEWLNPFGLTLPTPSLFGENRFSPRFDVSESNKEISISADVPGMKAEDFDITFQSNHLLISGERKMKKKESGESYTRIGRMYGSFCQQIPIPTDMVDETKIKAQYKNGVLQITLPKEQKYVEKSKKIPIKSV
jgi:HSP20 family protein